MGQMPDKTYTAPDGKIYKVEPDGSVTCLNDNEDKENTPHNDSTPDTKKSGNNWIWIIIIVLSLAAVVGGLIVFVQMSDSSSQQGMPEQVIYTTSAYQNDVDRDIDTIGSTTSNISSADSVTSSYEEETISPVFYPGGYQGEFYGYIDSLGKIYGDWSCGSEMGGGWYYFDYEGEEYSRELDFVVYEPLEWHERFEYEETGVWYFDYFDGTRDCIATGTYVRYYDNQSFRFRLYKQ